jgi:hypothetical protein
MPRIRDISGERFGRLTALEAVGKQRREVVWRCVCECGNIKDVRLSNLTNKNTVSCGCFQKEARYK